MLVALVVVKEDVHDANGTSMLLETMTGSDVEQPHQSFPSCLIESAICIEAKALLDLLRAGEGYGRKREEKKE